MDNDVDQALVDRYRSGDREAFTELVIRYQRPIYNAAYWILRSADDASDIAQDVFLTDAGFGIARIQSTFVMKTLKSFDGYPVPDS